jgi:hypothetical protein
MLEKRNLDSMSRIATKLKKAKAILTTLLRSFLIKTIDAVANHFYEQGKADAIKESIAKSKNVNMDPRQTNPNVIQQGGFSVRAVPGDSVSDFKVRIKK